MSETAQTTPRKAIDLCERKGKREGEMQVACCTKVISLLTTEASKNVVCPRLVSVTFNTNS